ncbi:MAG: hypothetical protein GY943_26720 [Chloroflexi bacterium]|nr:hypothetical protein [Chloroflexota bacterium]
MTDNQTDATRKARYGVTRRTHISVTHTAYDQIQTWADEQGISFSAAMESLALIGLGQDTAVQLPLLINSLLERLVKGQFNRFAKLLSLAVLSSEEANVKADMMLLNLIRQEAQADPSQFVQSMSVSTDPQNQQAMQIRKLREGMQRHAQEAALKRLKRPLAPRERITSPTADDVEDADG